MPVSDGITKCATCCHQLAFQRFCPELARTAHDQGTQVQAELIFKPKTRPANKRTGEDYRALTWDDVAALAQAEQPILASCPQALVVRTSAFFGPWDEYNFAHATLSSLARGQAAWASAAAMSPTCVPDLAHAMLDLLIDGAKGLWHQSNQGAVCWYEFAHMLARSAGLDHGAIEHLGDHAHGLAPITALVRARGQLMPSLTQGVERYLHDSRQRWRAAGVG